MQWRSNRGNRQTFWCLNKAFLSRGIWSTDFNINFILSMVAVIVPVYIRGLPSCIGGGSRLFVNGGGGGTIMTDTRRSMKKNKPSDRRGSHLVNVLLYWAHFSLLFPMNRFERDTYGPVLFIKVYMIFQPISQTNYHP